MRKALIVGGIGCAACTTGLLILVIAVVAIGAVTPTSRQQASVQPAATATPRPVVATATAVIQPTPPPVGYRIESDGVGLTANSARKNVRLSQFSTAKPGRVFVIVDVSIENVGRGRAPYNPLSFKVRDADGYEYSPAMFGLDDGLKSGDLEVGERVRGTVAFDVPTTASDLVLSYQAGGLFGSDRPIRIALGNVR